MQPRTKPKQNIDSDVCILTPMAVCEFLGISRSNLESLVRNSPDFPKALLLGVMRSSGRPSRIGWLKSEIENYARQLAKTRIDYSGGRAQVVRVDETVEISGR